MGQGDRDDPTDGDLVLRFRAGDRGAFDTLVSRHEHRVYNLAFRMLGGAEDARDASQETFLSCYRNLARFRGDAAFSTWMHRIAVNACNDMLRKRVPEPVPEPDDLALSEAHPDHAEGASVAVDVQRALLRLSVEFRAVLVLHDVQDLSYEEVAGVLEIPVGTVKSRLHRARVALARQLAGEPSEASAPSNPPTP